MLRSVARPASLVAARRSRLTPRRKLDHATDNASADALKNPLAITPRAWHELFRFGMLVKAVDGALQAGVGVALLLLSPSALNAVLRFLMRAELREDPRALLADLFLRAGQSVARVQIFAGVLLVSHGLIKLFLVAAVARHHRWAYPVAVAVFGGFVVYQSYRMAIRPSAFLWMVTIVDVVVLALIAHEYTTLAPRVPAQHG